MIAVTGLSTTIVRELAKLEAVERIDSDLHWMDTRFEIPATDRFVLAHGHLVGKPILEQDTLELSQTVSINLINTVRLAEKALRNPNARIVVIGSESAFLGSYDEAYAVSKGGLCAYAQWRKVLPTQTFAVLCPPIISDSGMTKRRHDYPQVLKERKTVTAKQVAQAALKILEGPTGKSFVERMC